MNIPETPNSISDLDLLKRLEEYAEGKATWLTDSTALGDSTKRACRLLHANLVSYCEQVLAHYLDRVTTREMEAFTLHDRVHGRKVSHLMWHLIEPRRRQTLSPAEIGLLVWSAHLHDLGMGLSPDEREYRLRPDAPLWRRLEFDSNLYSKFMSLRLAISDVALTVKERGHAERQLEQAKEALLCVDVRERHATKERYQELLGRLIDAHRENPSKIPDIHSATSYDGESFLGPLVEVCVSHNQDPSALIELHPTKKGQLRFSKSFPVGGCSADLQFIAATLRLADILDFDRERTPASLFYYLLPSHLNPASNRSVLEWQKHLSISHWNINVKEVLFRARCQDPVIHHAILQFCSLIEREIVETQAALGKEWPFILPDRVRAEIFEDGYKYIPNTFKLDEEKTYQLLMGRNLYDNSLVAVRELTQNAVDACQLRDAWTRLEGQSEPLSSSRIILRYKEPSDPTSQPCLEIEDSGCGMDESIISNYLFQVGRSYYSSGEFSEAKMKFKEKGIEFAPISEFGVGVISSFLLCDRIVVTTARWEPDRGDTKKRTLEIHGPTKLVRLIEEENEGVRRFKGTILSLFLTRGSDLNSDSPPTWEEVKQYIIETCLSIPYAITLEHHHNGIVHSEIITPLSLVVDVTEKLEPFSQRISVKGEGNLISGEIVVLNAYSLRENERKSASEISVELAGGNGGGLGRSNLMRGGIRVSDVPGLPSTYMVKNMSTANLKLEKNPATGRFSSTNISRTKMQSQSEIASDVLKSWLGYFIENRHLCKQGFLVSCGLRPALRRMDRKTLSWMEKYSALEIYEMARNIWSFNHKEEKIIEWEAGIGDSLSIGTFRDEIHWVLFDLILPHVTQIEMGRSARFRFKPPMNNWQDILKSCKDFVSKPVEWGVFVPYYGAISKHLFFKYPGSYQLNSFYESKVVDLFGIERVKEVVEVLEDIIEARANERIATLSEHELNLANRLKDVFGDVYVGTTTHDWPLNTFVMIK